MEGWTDGRWLARLGQQSHSRCPGHARRSRDPLGTEGRCDSAVSREGSCVRERGVLPLLQALGAGLRPVLRLPAGNLGNLEGRTDVTKE